MKRYLLPACLVGLFCFVGISKANRAPTPRPAAPKPSLRVEVDPKAKNPRLIIPSNALRRAPLGGFGAPPPADSRGGLSSLSTVVVGACLTMAFVCGGLWFMRRGNNGAIAALLVSIAFLGIGGATLYGDIAIPRPRPEKKFPGINVAKQVDVIVTRRGTEIRLIVSPAMKKQMTKAFDDTSDGRSSSPAPRSAPPVKQAPLPNRPK